MTCDSHITTGERESKNDVTELAEAVVGSPGAAPSPYSRPTSQNENVTAPEVKPFQSRKLPFKIQEAPPSLLESQFIDDFKEKDVVLPLPMLYQKVKKLSLLRRIHKRMKYFEFWGSRAKPTAHARKSLNVQDNDEEQKPLLLHTDKRKTKHTHNHFEFNRFMKALFRWLSFFLTGNLC